MSLDNQDKQVANTGLSGVQTGSLCVLIQGLANIFSKAWNSQYQILHTKMKKNERCWVGNFYKKHTFTTFISDIQNANNNRA